MSYTRFIRLAVIATFMLVSAAFSAEPAATKLRLMKITTKTARVIVGVIVEQMDQTIKLRDMKTDRVETYNRSDLKTVIEDPSDQEVVTVVKPGALFAWRISQSMPRTLISGKVAAIDNAIFYVSLGSNFGIRVDEELTVYRGEQEIKDPATGAVLGKQRRKVAKLKVIEVNEKLSKAKLLDDLEVEIRVGDAIEPTVKEKPVAVIPVCSDDGSISRGSLATSEEISTRLTSYGVPVVERSQLVKVLTELGFQNNALFDAEKSQKFGKQLGATYVITGRVIPFGKNGASLSIRTVDVASGKVTFGSTVQLSSFDFTPAPEPSDLGLGSTSPVEPKGNASDPPIAGATIDLIKLVRNPRDHVVKGSWQVSNDILANGAARSVIGFPVEVTGSYELTFELMRTRGDDVIFITLPVAKRNVYFEISSEHGGYHGLSFIDGVHSSSNGSARRPGRIENGNWHKVKVRVTLNGDRCTINATINGEKSVSWAGDPADLGADKNWTPPSKSQIGVATADARIELRKMEVKGAIRPER